MEKNNRLKIAIAEDQENIIYPGHFAHAYKFLILEYKNKRLTVIETRENPLNKIPDMDQQGTQNKLYQQDETSNTNIPLHGPKKYEYLYTNLLSDIDAIIAADACPTSVRVFSEKGTKILFTHPVKTNELITILNERPEELEQALEEPITQNEYHDCGCH